MTAQVTPVPSAGLSHSPVLASCGFSTRQLTSCRIPAEVVKKSFGLSHKAFQMDCVSVGLGFSSGLWTLGFQVLWLDWAVHVGTATEASSVRYDHIWDLAVSCRTLTVLKRLRALFDRSFENLPGILYICSVRLGPVGFDTAQGPTATFRIFRQIFGSRCCRAIRCCRKLGEIR